MSVLNERMEIKGIPILDVRIEQLQKTAEFFLVPKVAWNTILGTALIALFIKKFSPTANPK